jgi:hypothetical protein
MSPSLPCVATTRGVICGLWVCLFAFYYFSKGVFFPVIRGPLWSSPTVAPEPLRQYPLGTLLTVYIRNKLHMDLQANKSPVVVKGPFFS